MHNLPNHDIIKKQTCDLVGQPTRKHTLAALKEVRQEWLTLRAFLKLTEMKKLKSYKVQ